MDYGSLIWITLQRAKTPREAIQTMGDLVAQYGYYSSGESFSIGNSEEVRNRFAFPTGREKDVLNSIDFFFPFVRCGSWR